MISPQSQRLRKSRMGKVVFDFLCHDWHVTTYVLRTSLLLIEVICQEVAEAISGQSRITILQLDCRVDLHSQS